MSDAQFKQLNQLVSDLRKQADLELQDYKTVDVGRVKQNIVNKLRRILGTK